MTLTKSARVELCRRLAQSGPLGYDGFAVYWVNESGQEAADPEQPIWETQEQTGWKVKLVPVSHLPTESIHEAGGIRFFLGSDRTDHVLDFKEHTLWLDGEAAQLE